MKKLLSLSIALLSLNLYGAEKIILSKTGLEGWGKANGVRIIVEDYSNVDKTFDKKAIKNQVELKLRLAGIKVIEELSFDALDVDLFPFTVGGKNVGYHLTVKPVRMMTFKYNNKEYAGPCSPLLYGAGSTLKNYRPELDKYLDELLLNYLKANPITPKDQ